MTAIRNRRRGPRHPAPTVEHMPNGREGLSPDAHRASHADRRAAPWYAAPLGGLSARAAAPAMRTPSPDRSGDLSA